MKETKKRTICKECAWWAKNSGEEGLSDPYHCYTPANFSCCNGKPMKENKEEHKKE